MTGDVRRWLAELIDGNRAQIKKDLKALSPKDRLLVLEKLMQYVVPKQQATTLEVDYSKMTSVLVSKSWSHQAMWSMIFLREERERAQARVLPSSVVM